MSTLMDRARSWLRDYVTTGVPATLPNHPDKVAGIDVFAAADDRFASIETQIAAFLAGGNGLIYDTRANLFADLVPVANTLAWVVSDATVAQNGIYRKIGGTGAGSWTRVAELPYGVIKATNAGAGSANAIIATTALPIPAPAYSVLMLMGITAANTGAVTIAINGAAAKPLVTFAGGAIAASYLTAGMVIAFVDDGTSYRLTTDVSATAIVDAAVVPLSSGINELRNYTGNGPIWPIVTDSGLGVLLGFDMTLPGFTIPYGLLVARMSAATLSALASAGLRAYGGVGPLYPIIADNGGGTVVGVDSSSGALYGSAIDRLSGGGGADGDVVALAPADVPVRAQWDGFVVYGQSNATGADATPPISTTQHYGNKTFGSGPRSSKSGNAHGATNTSPGTSTAIALVENALHTDGYATEGESICTGAADRAVELAAQREAITPASFVIFASDAAHVSYTIANLNKASAWYPEIIDHVTEAKARATAAGKTYAIHAVMWDQGEADLSAGVLTRAAYAALLVALASDLDTDLRAITGQASPVKLLITQTAWGVVASGAQIVLGQFDAVNTSPLIHFVGPRWQMAMVAASYIHMTNVSQLRMSKYYGRAFEQMVIEGNEPDCLWPVSAWAVGTLVYCRYRVPHKPLRLNTEDLALTTDYGFKIVDGTGTLTLSAFTVVNGDTVRCTINRTLGASPKIRFALDYQAGSGFAFGGATGNITDDEPTSLTISGTPYRFRHHAPHSELDIMILEA